MVVWVIPSGRKPFHRELSNRKILEKEGKDVLCRNSKENETQIRKATSSKLEREDLNLENLKRCGFPPHGYISCNLMDREISNVGLRKREIQKILGYDGVTQKMDWIIVTLPAMD